MQWEQPTGARLRVLEALQARAEATPADPYLIGGREAGDLHTAVRLSDQEIGGNRWQARVGELALKCGYIIVSDGEDGLPPFKDEQGRTRKRYRLKGHLANPSIASWWAEQARHSKTKHNLAVTIRDAGALLMALRLVRERAPETWAKLELDAIEAKLASTYARYQR